jgi:hypothetical protein
MNTLGPLYNTLLQRKLLIVTLQKEHGEQNKTYRDVAQALVISEFSSKRLFSERTFVLGRLGQRSTTGVKNYRPGDEARIGHVENYPTSP